MLKKFTHAVGSAQKFANFWEGIHTIVGLPDSHHALVVRNGLPQSAARKVHLDQIKTFKERPQSEQESNEQPFTTPVPIAQGITPRIPDAIRGIVQEPANRRSSRAFESENKSPTKRSMSPRKHKPNIKASSEPIITRYGRTVKPPMRYNE